MDTQRLQRLIKFPAVCLVDDVVDKAAGIADQRLTLVFRGQCGIGIGHRRITAITGYLPLDLGYTGLQRRFDGFPQIGGQFALGHNRIKGVGQSGNRDAVISGEGSIGKRGGQAFQHCRDRQLLAGQLHDGRTTHRRHLLVIAGGSQLGGIGNIYDLGRGHIKPGQSRNLRQRTGHGLGGHCGRVRR